MKAGRDFRRGGERGQAAVEAALTLPLTLFLVLGTLQLGLLLQARVLTQYAAFRATRAGSVAQGDCTRMVDAAVAALVPAFASYLGPGQSGATPAQKLVGAWALRRTNRYAGSGTVGDGSADRGYDGPVVWIFREQPQAAQVRALPFGQDVDFDAPGNLMRLEVRLVFWAPLRIPFADWVFTRMVMAQWGMQDYRAVNPLLPTQTAAWTSSQGFAPETLVAQELAQRAGRRQYVFPIQATYTMRMMTPARAAFFQSQHCAPVP